MSEQFTERDCHILSIMLKGKGDWDYITTAGGFSNRKSAQKAARQVTAKLPLPPPTTGGLATQPQELPPPTTGGSFSQSRRELHTTGSKKGGPKSDASAGRVKTPKKGKTVRDSRPSTTFPLPLSVTVTCVKAPNIESTTDPTNPIKLTNAAVLASIVIPIPSPSSPEQNLSAKTAVTVKRHDPSAPYPNPSTVTPPFVPRATFRQGAVIRNGLVRDRMPSSDENVSAATAAYCTSTPIGNTLSRFGNEGPGAMGRCEDMNGPFAFRRTHVCTAISRQATPEFARTCTALRGPSPPAPPVDDVEEEHE
ncbi:hypothetical protein D0860_07685 [Hortaea werneckii]|uniref:Uncharacterized protein n=1 Tax=Hortaea werneckii TaxID=91943 RepID=A0A3M7GJN6_HORWE|nr:hypothetical protein D0860_07685 [Hortaea werneckii]